MSIIPSIINGYAASTNLLTKLSSTCTYLIFEGKFSAAMFSNYVNIIPLSISTFVFNNLNTFSYDREATSSISIKVVKVAAGATANITSE